MSLVQSRPSTRKLATIAVALAVSLVLSSCVLFRQGNEFAVGAETNRVNLVVYRAPSAALDQYSHASGTTAARNLLIDVTPSRISITGVYRTICLVNPTLCVGSLLLARQVVSWWRSDVRNRGDFHEALHEAKAERKCFAWTFVAFSGRNFTVKPSGNSGCR
jgi:hypothetical protein